MKKDFFVAVLFLVSLTVVGTAHAHIEDACYIMHNDWGCDDATCESIVCGIDNYCCDYSWDSSCVDLAVSNCTFNNPGDDNVPEFTTVGAGLALLGAGLFAWKKRK